MAALAALKAAHAAGDLAAVLRHALLGWRDGRDPHLAALILQIDGQLGYTPPLTQGPSFQDQWLALATPEADVVTVGWLARHLLAQVGGRYRRGARHLHLRKRMDRLAAYCPDPRIAEAVMGILRKGPQHMPADGMERTLRPMLALLERAGDPRVGEEVKHLAAFPPNPRASERDAYRVHLPATARALLAIRAVELDAADRAFIEPLLPRPAATPHDTEALLEAVLQHPRDAGLREVLGDAWIQEGGPRGALVALERAGVPPVSGRVKRIVRAHLESWLGPVLAKVLEQVRFRDGLLDRARLRPVRRVDGAFWSAAFHDPRLATLRILEPDYTTPDCYLSFVTSPQMRDLRQLELLRGGMLRHYLDSPPRPIEILQFGAGTLDLADLERAEHSGHLSHVRTLGITARFPVDALAEHARRLGWSEQLTRLEVRYGWNGRGDTPGIPHLAALLDRFPALTQVAWHVATHTITLRQGPAGWVAEVRLLSPAFSWRVPGWAAGDGELRSLAPADVVPLLTWPVDVAEVHVRGQPVAAAWYDAVTAAWPMPVYATVREEP